VPAMIGCFSIDTYGLCKNMYSLLKKIVIIYDILSKMRVVCDDINVLRMFSCKCIRV